MKNHHPHGMATPIPSTSRRWSAWRGLLVPSCACTPRDLRDDGHGLTCEGCRSPARPVTL